jgi:hypothetical protein
MKKLIYLVISGIVLTFHLSNASGSETGWSPVIIATGAYREQIKSTPIELRPNRPLHFYGNAVRRDFYQAPSRSVFSRQMAPQRRRFLRY